MPIGSHGADGRRRDSDADTPLEPLDFAPLVRRLVLFAGFLLCVAFAWYGSLVPLQFKPLTFDEAVRRFLADAHYSPLARASGSDFVANVLLFVPIGFFLAGALADRSRSVALLVFPAVLGAGVALSVVIEFTQVFSSGRTPSWNDVIAESLGACGGALLWLLVGSRSVEWTAGALIARTAEERALRALSLYAGLWLILGVLPLDFTLRPAEVVDKLRSGRVIVSPLPPLSSLTAATDSIATLLWAVPLGGLGVLTARRLRLPGIGPGVVFGLLLVIGLELLQLLVLSRWTKAYDVTLGSAGVAAGAFIAARVLHSGASLRRAAGVSPVRFWPLAVLAAWIVVLLVRHWSPFEFRLDGAFVRGRLAMLLAQVPFQGYYWGDPLNALVEATTKVLLGLPVGAALQLTWWPVTNPTLRRVQLAAAATVAMLLFGAIEVGQVLLPERYPDLTDVLLGVIGSLGGVALARLLWPR